MKKKYWFIIPLVVVVVAVIWYISSTQWTRDFDLRYVEFVSIGNRTGGTDYSHYLYEITNNTNRTLKDVSVVIFVDDVGKDFEYEDFVTYSIKPGETIEYKLYTKDYQKAAEEQGEILAWVSSVDIVKIKYSR